MSLPVFISVNLFSGLLDLMCALSVCLSVFLSLSLVLACSPMVKPRERNFLKTLRLVSSAEACTVEQHGRVQEEDDGGGDDDDKGVGLVT